MLAYKLLDLMHRKHRLMRRLMLHECCIICALNISLFQNSKLMFIMQLASGKIASLDVS